MMRSSVVLTTLMLCREVLAQGVVPDFPPSAVTPSGPEIASFITDRPFQTVRLDGTQGEFVYRSDGTFDVIYTSFKEFGKWQAEEGKICVDDPLNGKACNEVRIADGNLLYRRNKNREVLTLKPR